jgi:hypothetical protein
MLVDVVQIMESQSKWELWDFQVIISSTTKASVPYLCQKKYLEVSRPGVGGRATFIVETGSHPAFASHLLEVQVRGDPLHPSDIKALVEGYIESMQPPASSARKGETKGPDSVFLMALEGLMVWAVPSKPRMDVKCVLAVSTLKGTMALLCYGHGLDRWANKNPLWGADGGGVMFGKVVIDMFNQVTCNKLCLLTFVKDGKPGFLTYSPHVGAFHFIVVFNSDIPVKKDDFLTESFGASLLQIHNGYCKSSNYRDRVSRSRWMLSADVKKVAIMQPEGRDHALNFEKMMGLQFENDFVVSCELHVRHYEDESRLFGYFST